VRINPLLVFIAVLAGASLGTLIGGIFGGFVAALLAIPTAGARRYWSKRSGKPPPQTSPRNPRRLRLRQQTSIPRLEIEGASGSCPRNAGSGALVS